MIVFALSGSTRNASFNTSLLRAAVALAPKDMTFDVASIRGVPLYDGDEEEAHGIPEAVQELKRRASRADALFLASPEYNGGVPGVLKNAIDWMSRGADSAKVFKKPVALVGASPGPAGTRLAQVAWLPTFRQLGMIPYFGHSLFVDNAAKAFSAQGERELVDPKVIERLTAYLQGFGDFVRVFASQKE